jgi:hypothetical protein
MEREAAHLMVLKKFWDAQSPKKERKTKPARTKITKPVAKAGRRT